MLFLLNFITTPSIAFSTNRRRSNLPRSRYRRDFDSDESYIPKKSGHQDMAAGQKRRGVDIELKVATRRPTLKFDLLKELELQLKNLSESDDDFDGKAPCPECDIVAEENGFLKEVKQKPRFVRMRPAYACDTWDHKTRTCWLDRNIGDTVTFVLAFDDGISPHVQWRQEFHMLHSKKKKFFILDPENPLWNIVIGSRGHEMRLSPITEIDIDDNFFSARVIDGRNPVVPSLSRVNFRIRMMPIDQGFVYPGETLIMNMRRVSLPPKSMIFKWYLENEGESGTLPSNMKLSPSGSVLTISELRKEQEGILACSVFTNKGYFATKQRFLIKEMNQSSNMLLFDPIRPHHSEKETNKRRKRQLESADYIDQALEEHQKMNARLKNVDKNYPENYQNKAGNPYAIENIDIYHDSNNRNFEPIDPISSFKQELLHPVNRGHFGPPRPNFVRHPNRGQFESNDIKPVPRIYDSDVDSGNIILEIAKKPVISKPRPQDQMSKMISWCNNNSQCSTDASCVLGNAKISHFCRCNLGFQGIGIFCWEDLKIKNLAAYREDFPELETTELIFTEAPLIKSITPE